MRPATLVDITRLPLDRRSRTRGGGVRIGALVANTRPRVPPADRSSATRCSPRRCSPARRRRSATWPRVGGNLLQRTRCPYFRDPHVARATSATRARAAPRSTASRARTRSSAPATSASRRTRRDMCVALAALDAVVHVHGPRRASATIPFADFHTLPGDHPGDRDACSQPGELITHVELPAIAVRAALALRQGARPRVVRVRAGIGRGRARRRTAARSATRASRSAASATKPWRSEEAEAALVGQPRDAASVRAAARPRSPARSAQPDNAFKVELAKRTIVRALERRGRCAHERPSVGKPHRSRRRRARRSPAARPTRPRSPVANVAHAVIVGSAIAQRHDHGSSTSRAAEAAPGVLAVLTHDNAPKLARRQQEARARSTVAPAAAGRRDPLSPISRSRVVVADTLERAQHAAALVTATYDARRRRADARRRRAARPTRRRRGPARRARHRRAATSTPGSPRAKFKVDATYTTPVENHNPMEPHATIAVWQGDDHLTSTTRRRASSACASGSRRCSASPKENVRVIDHFVGGGFGCKGSPWSHVALAAMAAKVVEPAGQARRHAPADVLARRPPARRRSSTSRSAADAHGQAHRDRARRRSSETSRFDEFVEPCGAADAHALRVPERRDRRIGSSGSTSRRRRSCARPARRPARSRSSRRWTSSRTR